MLRLEGLRQMWMDTVSIHSQVLGHLLLKAFLPGKRSSRLLSLVAERAVTDVVVAAAEEEYLIAQA